MSKRGLDLPTVRSLFEREHGEGFGFPLYGDMLLLATIRGKDPKECVSKIHEKTKSHSVACVYTKGCWQLAVHYSEWRFVPDLLAAALAEDHTLNLGHLSIPWHPTNHRFRSDMERLLGNRIREAVSNFTSASPQAIRNFLGPDLLPRVVRPWNWFTTRGKETAQLLRNTLGMPPLDPTYHGRYSDPDFLNLTEVTHTLHHSRWYGPCSPQAWQEESDGDDDDADLLDMMLPGSPKHRRTTEETEETKEAAAASSSSSAVAATAIEELTCIVCLQEVPALTLVLPCEHMCVCADCAVGLQNTPKAQKCLRCDRPITLTLQNT